ncbi:helix-turn-helix transcriptional regulator [Micromonospora sp. WMMD1082]|uniref:helix-turn-helix transcriptional regulator n=1 Tax=Micromonospora sp. WMMD1082 TaxID=3016104 RepID=UPI002415A5F1|nr:helix-turn-helix transcriptional regulator [Micromonospora sp. WMMD1082]MDG4793039.1 helix-turn-helix transcriptional regulator [Micromonospora sp. WMMD1082]
MPPVPRRFGTAGGITPTDIAEARKELGRHLAQWRAVAGLRQVDLAKLIRYSRSQIANVEVGRDNTTRVFWRNADAALGARGALLAMSDRVRALVQDFQAQRDHARDQGRQQAGTSAPPIPPVVPCPVACGCGLAVVGRWTTREVRALREALRMSLRAFSEHLDMTIAAVSSWEHRSTPALDEQSVLDQALTTADSHAKARFWLLLDNPEDPIPGAHDHPATTRRPTATPIHHANRIRPAS